MTAHPIRHRLVAKSVRRTLALAAAALAGAATPAPDAETVTVLEEVSVTATREVRATRDVPLAISVVSKEEIEDAKMFNVKDALTGVPGVLIDSKTAATTRASSSAAPVSRPRTASARSWCCATACR